MNEITTVSNNYYWWQVCTTKVNGQFIICSELM